MIQKTDYKLERKKCIFASFCIVMICFCLPFFTSAEAPVYDTSNFNNGVASTAFYYARVVYGGTVFDGVIDALKLSFDGGALEMAWGPVKFIYTAMQGLGRVMLLLFLLLELIDQASQENKGIEMFVFPFAKFVAGLLIINNMMVFVQYFLSFSSEIIENITGGGGASDVQQTIVDSYYRTLASAGISESMKAWFELLFPWMLMSVVRITISIAVYARVFQVVIYTVFSPIGVADVYGEGTNSKGFKFILKLFATCLKGVIMTAIIIITSNISGAQVLDSVGSAGGVLGAFFQPIYQIIVGFITITLILKSGKWVEEITNVSIEARKLH